MARPITLMTSQWADLDLDTMCRTAKELGYDGIELACQGKHLDVKRAATDMAYVQEVKDTLAKYDVKLFAIAAHIIGQCVGDYNDPRLNNFAPAELADKPDEIRAWGIEYMKYAAIAAKNAPRQSAEPVKTAPVKRKLSYRERRELESLPARMEALETEIAEIESALGDPSIYSKDPARAAALAERLEPAKAELDDAETRWLELSEI